MEERWTCSWKSGAALSQRPSIHIEGGMLASVTAQWLVAAICHEREESHGQKIPGAAT